MKRFFAVFLVALILCVNVLGADVGDYLGDDLGFRIVEDCGDGYKIVTWNGVAYYKVSDDDAAACDWSNGELVAWEEEESAIHEEYHRFSDENTDTSVSSVSPVADVPAASDINNPLLAEAIARGDSVYVLSGDLPYADESNVNAAGGGDLEYVGTQLYSLSPITASDATGLKAALLSVLGNYDTIVTVHQYQNSNNYYSYVTDVQPDYVWLAGAALLLLLIYCLFRLGGALIHG